MRGKNMSFIVKWIYIEMLKKDLPNRAQDWLSLLIKNKQNKDFILHKTLY